MIRRLTSVVYAETGLDTGGPLERAGDAVSSVNLVEEEGANVGGGLGKDSGTVV